MGSGERERGLASMAPLIFRISAQQGKELFALSVRELIISIQLSS